MRNTFLSKTKDDRVIVSEGTFVETGLKSGWVDALFIAQAFHWAHPNYEAAMKEMARVLKPNASAFLIWNLEDRDRSAWVASIRDIYEAYENHTPQFRLNLWEAAFETPSYRLNFRVAERFSTKWSVETTVEGVRDRVFSKSYVTVLKEEDKRGLWEKVEAVLRKEDELGGIRWIDRGKGVFEYPYQTFVIHLQRK